MGTLGQIKRRVPFRVRDALRPAWPESARPWLEGSFSQCGEDRLVAFLFGMIGIEQPTYLDLGAYHPWRFSNTALLYLSGCRGVNVEANPDALGAFFKDRPGDRNLNVGVGPEPGVLTFYRMSADTLNTFSAEAAHAAVEQSGGRYTIIGTQPVEIQTVPQILGDRPTPDLVSLDVEGMDVEILQTLPTWPGRPAVVCVETATYSETGGSVKLTEPADLVSEFGYVQFADTWVNTIFVREDLYQR